MRRLPLFCGATLLALALSLSAFKPNSSKGPSANGQGTLTIEGKLQTFSFHASTNSGGGVSGSFEVNGRGQDLRLHGTITCLTILPDGKTAFVSGIITQRVGEGLPGVYLEGEYVFFEVQDNGEGRNAAGDKFSDVFPSGSIELCGPYPMDLYPIENGNIQVKP